MNVVTRLKGMQYLRQRQRGAVAIMFGLSLLALFGFMALVFDLGRTYVVRTELQNAADAAALAGAKDLNQKLSGVTKAIATVQAIGLQNNTKFSFNGEAGIVITDDMISVSNCPDLDTCTWTKASTIVSNKSDVEAADKTFLKVDIPSGGLATFFARVPTTLDGAGISETRTYGLAVAGRFVNDITPIGICAIKDASGESRPEGEVLPNNELAQFGFRRGVSYNIFQLNGPGLPPSSPYLLDPVDVYPNGCNPANASANTTAPFICSGSSAILTATPGAVYGNTGVSAGKIQAALNSRFNEYGGPSVCVPDQAPPDTNIRKYGFATGVDWMTPTPTVQNMLDPNMPMPPATTIASADKYGVLWSYSRAVTADASVNPPKPGTPFAATAANWAVLYPTLNGVPPAPNANFPATVSPYNDPAHSTLINTGLPNRRVLNLPIADCPEVTGIGSCLEIPILGIGRFFMQTPASEFSGGPNAKLDVEFSGLIDPVPIAEIRLYR